MIELNRDIGKFIIIAGGVIFLCGIMIYFFHDKIKLFNLPGDIIIEKENFTLYFPITTMIIISIIFSLLMKLFK